MPELRIDDSVLLSDGRRLAFAEYGEADGEPIFLFHGLPGSRLSWGRLPGSPFRRGLRVIASDRPGYGGSDPRPGRTLLDWPDDVSELAAALGIDRFAVLGVSGGGPGTLACAWKIPKRLSAVGVVSSPCPVDAPPANEDMSRINRFFIRMAARAPKLSRLNMYFLAAIARRYPAKYVDRMAYKLSDVDKVILARTEIRDFLITDFPEAFRQGGDGAADDLILNHGLPWGFPLEQVSMRVDLWYGEDDTSVPPSMGRYLEKTLPAARATFIPHAGHLWVLDHMSEVLDQLVPSQSDPRREGPA